MAPVDAAERKRPKAIAERAADVLAVLEAGCMAMLAEITRQRQSTSAEPPRRRRGPARLVVPTSETCRQAARNALIDLQRAGLLVKP